MPDAQKRARADFVVDTERSPSRTSPAALDAVIRRVARPPRARLTRGTGPLDRAAMNCMACGMREIILDTETTGLEPKTATG